MRLLTCLGASLAVLALYFSAGAGEAKYKVESAKNAVPAELAPSVRKLFRDESIQFADAAGKTIAEFWFRPEIPVDATPEQIKNGLTYKEVRQTEIVGAVRFDQDWSDYRKQKVKAGVYTLRLGYQPMDGDHQGSSEFQDFLVVTSASMDKNAELLEVKDMVEHSAKSISTGHPGVFMLFPVAKPGAEPKLENRARNHVFLSTRADSVGNGKKTGATLGIGLNIVGHAE